MKLIDAIKNGFYFEVENLIKKNIPVNVKNYFDQEKTPLHYAAIQGSAEIIELLIKKGHAKINEPAGKSKLSPLHMAVSHGNINAVKKLLLLGADIDQKFKYDDAKQFGNSLDIALLTENYSIAAILLRRGIKFEKSDFLTESLLSSVVEDNTDLIKAFIIRKIPLPTIKFPLINASAIVAVAACANSVKSLKLLDQLSKLHPKLKNIFDFSDKIYSEESKLLNDFLQILLSASEVSIEKIPLIYSMAESMLSKEMFNLPKIILSAQKSSMSVKEKNFAVFSTLCFIAANLNPELGIIIDENTNKLKLKIDEELKDKSEDELSKIMQQKLHSLQNWISENFEVNYDKSNNKFYISKIKAGLFSSINFDSDGSVANMMDKLSNIKVTLKFLKEKGLNINQVVMFENKEMRAAKEILKSPVIVIKAYMDSGLKFTNKDLHYAINKHDAETVKFLVEQGVDTTGAIKELNKTKNDMMLNHSYDLIRLIQRKESLSKSNKSITNKFNSSKKRKFKEISEDKDEYKVIKKYKF